MNESNSAAPVRRLSLFDAVSIIVGIIIGAGIYRSTPAIAGSVSSPALLLGVWLAGGIISLAGALCFAELATTYTEEGGNYVYLRRAFGRRIGFLFAWAELWIIRPGNLGAMAFVYALYADDLVPLDVGPYRLFVHAVGAVAALTVVNLLGVSPGKWTQNILTAAKVLGILVIFTAAVAFLAPAANETVDTGSRDSSNLSLAMILVLFTYGGWNEIAYVAAEVKHPEKNIFRTLCLGVVLVTAVYLLVNIALLRGLGFAGTRTSSLAATGFVQQSFGPWGGKFMSLLICLSCLGAINGMIFTGSRIWYALGKEHRLYRWLGAWNGVPRRSLLLQSTVTLTLMAVFGLQTDQFERLVVFTAPWFWFFLLLVGLGLFLLRFTDRQQTRVYRVFLYPVTPLLFCASSGFMFYSSIQYMLTQQFLEAFWGVAVMIAGLALSLYDPKTK